MFPEADIRAIAVNPNDPSVMFAGTEAGVCRSKDGGDSTDGGNSWIKLKREFGEVRAMTIVG